MVIILYIQTEKLVRESVRLHVYHKKMYSLVINKTLNYSNSITMYMFTAFLGGVYKRKLAPARVSSRDDFLISNRVLWWLGHFISCYLKVHFMLLIKYTCDSKSQTLLMRYPFQATSRPIFFYYYYFICHIIITKNIGKEEKKRSGEET